MNKIRFLAGFTALLTAFSAFAGCGTRSATTEIVDTPIITVTITEPVTENFTETSAEILTSQTEAETFTESLTETETVTESEVTKEVQTEAVSDSEEGYPTVDDSYVEYHFRSKKLLNQHFEKHGAEFDGDFNYQNADEYESGASDVINNSDALFKYEKEDGDGVYYIEATNEFVILSKDGYIRTYFRPNSGKKYFDRQ